MRKSSVLKPKFQAFCQFIKTCGISVWPSIFGQTWPNVWPNMVTSEKFEKPEIVKNGLKTQCKTCLEHV